ncbi:MAG TPA: ABC transporter ATP-binding protein [Bryobacteraceae bacterium]|nr:ABC transporter ATP-binding protein [Bryobacteraceae bacterium]
MKTLYRYLRDYWNLVVLALVLAAINQIFSMMDPWILQRIIDRYASHPAQFTGSQFVRGVAVLIGLGIGAAFVSRVAKNFQDYFLNLITQQVGARIYSDGIQHSLDLPYADFEDQRSGETLGRLQKVRTDVEKLLNVAVNLLFTTLIGVVVVMVYAAHVYWAVGPIYLLTIPLLGGLSSLLSKKIKTVQQVIVRETTALAGSTTESLRNIELVKSLGLAKQEIGRLNSTTDRILSLELKKIRYLRSLSFIQGTVVNFLRSSIQFLMMFLIFKGKMTLGDYMAMFIYSFFIFGPLQELGNVVNTYREAEVSLQNFDEILAMKPEPRPANPVPVTQLDTLEFRDAGFQHQSASKPALSGISFTVTRGKTIAFVGPSGAGKTTLVKLLVGLYRPQTGHIYYNGVREDEIEIDGLRNRIGFVTQDSQLFSGSIRENLLFVQPNATDTECMDVLRQASVQTLLARADRGLDTVIGEGGVKVSGGEKQRLSIARALLRRPQLLVFDEATSSLDSLTEEEISHTIRSVAAGRDAITILIAHRLSTVMHADAIYVLERGRIVESGRHDELVERKGLYYAMWRQQVGEAALAGATA